LDVRIGSPHDEKSLALTKRGQRNQGLLLHPENIARRGGLARSGVRAEIFDPPQRGMNRLINKLFQANV
jgi:hypothetical protein